MGNAHGHGHSPVLTCTHSHTSVWIDWRSSVPSGVASAAGLWPHQATGTENLSSDLALGDNFTLYHPFTQLKLGGANTYVQLPLHHVLMGT